MIKLNIYAMRSHGQSIARGDYSENSSPMVVILKETKAWCKLHQAQMDSKYQPEEKNDGNADDQGSEGDNADGNDAEGNDADGDDAADDETVDVDAEDGSTEDGGENTDETIVVDEDGNEIDLDNLEVEDVTE
jgi:hypothetical protein